MSESSAKLPTDQPPVSEADRDRAEAALVPQTFAGMPPTAQAFFAVVAANGALVRGFGVVSSTRLGVGTYQVVFSHDVTGSAFLVTTGLTGSVGVAPAGYAAVVGRAGVPNGVFVETFGPNGVFADRAFHMGVLS